MILREISDTSIVISLFRYLYRWCDCLEQRVSYIYQNSRTYRLTERLWKKIKVAFKYSFLGKITETKQTTAVTFVVLDNSQAVQYLVNFYKRWKDKVIGYSGTSLTTELAKDTKEEFNLSAVRTASVIVGVAVVTNVFLSLVLKKQIGLWGWSMRGLFSIAGVWGLFCKADWTTVKESSTFLRKMRKD